MGVGARGSFVDGDESRSVNVPMEPPNERARGIFARKILDPAAFIFWSETNWTRVHGAANDIENFDV